MTVEQRATSVTLFYTERKDVKVNLDDLKTIEDLIFKCTRDIQCNNINRHLFGLLDVTSNTSTFLGHWLPLNQSIQDSLKDLTEARLELRVRYKPGNLSSLRNDDSFLNYYFNQLRNDFLKIDYVKSDKDRTSRVLGLSIIDALRHFLETDPYVEEQDFVRKGDILAFLPSSFKHLGRAKKEECKQQMTKAWHNSDRDVKLTKEEYIRALTCDFHIIPDYHAEYYKASLDTTRSREQVLLKFDPQTHYLVVRRCNPKEDANALRISNGSTQENSWGSICSVEELCFVSIQSNSLSVQIARKNGIPQSLLFRSQPTLKSFVSLLDGYYRLSEKWFFSVCRDVSSPLLTSLKSVKCHGPVGRKFAHHKLLSRQEAKAGNYILRRTSQRQDNEMKMDVLEFEPRNSVKTIRITTTKDSKYKTDLNDKSFDTPNELLSHVKQCIFGVISVTMSPLPPSENDHCPRLLICKLPSHEVDVTPTATDPVVIRGKFLQPISFESFTRKDANHFTVDLFQFNDRKVIVKRLKGKKDTQSTLKIIDDWIHIKSDFIVQMIGVVVHPTSLVTEFLELGPLDQFLKQHQQSLKPVDLIEAAQYTARALLHLDELNLVHGCVRCHNFLVANFSPTSLKVKLSDPLCDLDKVRDAPWIAPEFAFGNIFPTTSVDVYALGTTLWQLFSYGSKPDSNVKPLIDLVQPFGCPNDVWDLIKNCWGETPGERLSSQSIVRDLSQILYEVYNCRRHNCYTPLIESTMKRDKGFYHGLKRSIFGSSGTLSLRSSMMSSKTVLTGLGSSTSDLISLSSRNPYDIVPPQDSDTWIIEANQLSLDQGKVLGQGCYGEVIKAVLTKWSGLQTEVVAVKRVNPSINLNLGVKDMRREIEIMKQLNHKNIVEIKGVVEDPQVMLVMEYLEMGSLASYLKVTKDRQSVCDPCPLKKFALDIVEGMIYLESKSVIHRDLAARNVLVASPNLVKISDFGLAQVISGEYYKIRTERGLPLRWYAPESIKFGTFSHKSDVWSFGVTLWEMYTFGMDPKYEDAADDSCLLEVLERKIRLPMKEFPIQVYEVMMRCWEDKPSDRPSFQDLKREIEGIIDN